jgi:membrane associated rhomboid family serine protease
VLSKNASRVYHNTQQTAACPISGWEKMIPIKDTIRSRSFPLVNWLLIIGNVLVFIFMVSLGPDQLRRFIFDFGLVQASLEVTNPLTWYPVFTHMFLHGGWFHLLSNVWILFIFGDNVEDRIGSGRFLIFYIMGGIAAGLLQGIISLNPNIPSLGASGAIAAVMGAYILFYPRARVTVLLLLIIIPIFFQVPAVVFLGVWFISQLYSGLLALGEQAGQWGGVAWWAHIGGFVFGLVFARIFAIGRRPQRWFADEYYPY